MEFKDNVKLLRIEGNYSFADIASIVGKSEAAVRAWEYGRAKPEADTLIALARLFGCSSDFLLGLSGHRTESEKQDRAGLMAEIENSMKESDPDTLNFLHDFIGKLGKLPMEHRREITDLVRMHLSRDFTLKDRQVFSSASKLMMTLSLAPKAESSETVQK
ncbi:MAG: helix-turn-helix domain-containing protein [Defluviitaleaceae bacterium]|nr:helix-turn-helix domain-containing protein [Defluviitaleaceae bacterium]